MDKPTLCVFNLVDGYIIAGRLAKETEDAYELEDVLDLMFTTSPNSGQYLIIFNKRSFVFNNRTMRFPKNRVVDYSADLLEGFEEFYEAAVNYTNQGVKMADLKGLAKEINEQAQSFAQQSEIEKAPTLDETSIESLFKEVDKRGGNKNNLN